MEGTRLKDAQYAAMRKSFGLGRTLQLDIGDEITRLFREGLSYEKIASDLDIMSGYGVRDKTARNAVNYAVMGYDGKYDDMRVDSYEGLLNDDERKTLAKQHKVDAGHKSFNEGTGLFSRDSDTRLRDSGVGGVKAYRERKGYHARTSEQMSADGINGGTISFKKGLGVHDRSSEEHRQDSLKGVEKSLRARGLKAWMKKGDEISDGIFCIIDEIEYAHNQSLKPEYQYDGGPNKGKNNNVMISSELNNVFHGGERIRTNDAVQVNLRNYRKSIEDIT